METLHATINLNGFNFDSDVIILPYNQLGMSESVPDDFISTMPEYTSEVWRNP